jgi:hypothetical protein
VNVTGVKPLAEAVREFDPATVPRVHPPTVATPDTFVVTELPVIVPPPLAMVNVTGTPAIAEPRWSFTITEANSVTAAPATAVREVLEFGAMLVAKGGATDVSAPPHAPRPKAIDNDMRPRSNLGDLTPAEFAMNRRSDATALRETNFSRKLRMLNPSEAGESQYHPTL